MKTSNHLPYVCISRSMMQAYQMFCLAMSISVGRPLTDPTEDRGFARDKEFVIWTDVPEYGRVEFIVPEGEWIWKDQN